jgi:hypothetical protein
MPVRQIYEPNLNIGAQSGWCLQYVDDAINSLTRSPNAQTAYLNELNTGRINTGPAPVGVWVIGFLGFSRGQYTEDGHVFLMRKREDGSIEIHDSEVHSGARGIYNSIEELMNWMGNYGPDYLGYSYCCDGRCIAEDYDETQPTDRKMEEDGNARDEANTNSAIFQELEKGDVIAMKGYITNGQPIAGDTVWYVTARSGKYMSRQLFEDKDLHDLTDLTPKTAPQPQPEPQEDYSKIILDVSNHQDDSIVNHFHKFAGVILKAGHVGQSFGGDANKIDPKLVKFAKAAGDKLLGIYWLPYFSTEEEVKVEAERFVEAQKLVNAPLLFVDLEPDFEGTVEQLKLFKNLVLQKTGKQVFTYAGEAIIRKLGLDRVDWYPNYGTKDNYAHGSFIHQYSETLTVPEYDGKLDANVSNKSIDELRSMGVVFPKPQETPQNNETDIVPSEPEKPQEVPNNKPKEEKVTTPVFNKEDIEAIEKVTAEEAKLVQGLAETDEAQEIIKGISKRTKLVVYIIGDLLLGASAIAPQIAIAVLSGDPYVKTNAISGALATAGLFLLTMFGIYKNGKNK